MHYHSSVAVAHFARRLAEDTVSGGAYQPVAVLALLWTHAVDQFADTAVVFVAAEYMVGLVPNDARMRQTICLLRKVGAVARERVRGGGYLLVKPALADLDDLARAQIARSDATALVRGQPSTAREKVSEHDSAKTRNAALIALGKQPSDVRDVLAVTCGLAKDKRNNMRYSGKGSQHVQLATDWIAETGATWTRFRSVCKAAYMDKSPDKPTKLEWLFAPRNADYLNRLLAQVTA